MRASFCRLSLKCGPGFPWQNRVFLRQIWNGVSLLWQPYLCIGQSTQTVVPPGRTGCWWYSHHFFPVVWYSLCSKGPQRDTWGNQTAKHISGDLTLWTLESWDLHMPSMWQKNRVLPWESQLQEGGRRKASWSETTGCLTCSVVQGNGGSGGCRWGEPRDPEDQSWRGCILGISVVFRTLSSLHLRFLAHSGSVLTNKLSNTARVSCKGLSEAQCIETWVGKVLPGDAWDRLASKLSSCCED